VGVLVDYFAATPNELAGLDLRYGLAGSGWPHVDCKGWLDGLDTLAAELTGRDLSEFGDQDELGDGELVSGDVLLTRVPAEVTGALAGVTDARLRAYAEEELLHEHEIERCTELRDLARSAVTAGRDVYCWSSL
jgi:hypothetical protein